MRKRDRIKEELRAARERSNQLVEQHMAERRAITRTHHEKTEELSLGQRAADAMARFGGSWSFIGLFFFVLIGWMVLNTFILAQHGKQAFDPYPYILLNLVLSMLAAFQAPVIMMSQNRQAEKDRMNAQHDYEVNLKAELEIMLLHEKLDELQIKQWEQLIEMQRQQLALLGRMCKDEGNASPASV